VVSSQQKHNARNQFYALRALRFLCACISVFLSVSHEQRALRPLRCVRQLGTELKSVFIGLCAVSRLSYATHAKQRTHEIQNACTQKTQRTQSILFFALRFLCAYIACIASVALHTTSRKPTFKSVFCILMAAALFRRSAHVRQPSIAKFLFVMDEQFVKFDDRCWSGI